MKEETKTLLDYEFGFIEELKPKKDANGNIETHCYKDEIPESEANEYIDETFCKFSLSSENISSGVIAIFVDDELIFVGETKNLKKRINRLGKVSEKKCKKSGNVKLTCRVNSTIFRYFQERKTVDLYFHYEENKSRRVAIRQALIDNHHPECN